MGFLAFAAVLLMISGVMLRVRYTRNADASRQLAENEDEGDAVRLTAREKLALALAYPVDDPLNDHVHEIIGECQLVQGNVSDRRLYIGDLWVLVHDSMSPALDTVCTARIVRTRDKALVVELNGQPILPTLVDTRDAIETDGRTIPPDQQVRILDETQERGVDHELRMASLGLESGCVRTFAMCFLCLGALIIMLAAPSLHPFWFAIGCVPLALGILGCLPSAGFKPPEHGDRLYRLHGRVIVAEQPEDVPGLEALWDERASAYTRLLSTGAVKPRLSGVYSNRPVPIIGNVALKYPGQWLEALRHRTPETVDVMVTDRGDVVAHGPVSRYDELRRFRRCTGGVMPPRRYSQRSRSPWRFLTIHRPRRH
ncbi:hypothetical protein [Salinisphaera sp. Q1T1-3]|uniref:hypothetical protein n=1 Tax=Salinisphaera sp. Q1T1-3 TaxID=2321229 RepID=UPI000E7124C7|nr:hypothetical protein [Salinisphaera sp. Q1T1-3]RJS93599.1 hypothetical protein D3260_07935 [Salinisphaera sp. Q1T1-3]